MIKLNGTIVNTKYNVLTYKVDGESCGIYRVLEFTLDELTNVRFMTAGEIQTNIDNGIWRVEK